MANTWLLLIILFGGACYDIREHRIPNWWIAWAAVCGLALLTLTAPEGRAGWEAGGYLFRILLSVTVCFPLFLLRMIGAGDIKLMAVMIGCLGFGAGLKAIAFGAVAGAGIGLLKLLIHRNLFQRLHYLIVYFRRMFLTKEIVPYYRADRDGYGAAIPFAACLLAGYVWYLLTEVL